MRSRWIALMALALAAGLGVAPAGAQTEHEREELEVRLRELRTEMLQLERSLMEMRGNQTMSFAAPRVMAFSSNRARLGVTVQNRADEATDEMGAVVWSAGHEPFVQAADRNSYKQAAISGTVLRLGDGAALQLLPGLRSVDRAVLPE